MSEDDEKVADEITELGKALITAHVKFISKHHKINNAGVITATALFMAVIVDTLSHGDDDPTEDETMEAIGDIVEKLLENRSVLRSLTKAIVDTEARVRQ
jgi:hypothetical protein